MHLSPVQDLAALRVWHDIASASLQADHTGLPADPVEELAALIDPATPQGAERQLLRLGHVDDQAVSAVVLHVPVHDNLAACTIDLQVPPDERRRGHGRAALETAVDDARGLGRTRLFFEVPSPYDGRPGPAEPLLRSVGARPVLREVRRLLDLAQDPPAPPPPPPVGYRLVHWGDRLPDAWVDDMAYLMFRMSTDAPLGEMDWEPEVWDAARYRAREDVSEALGRSRCATLVVSEESGHAVGFTAIGVSRYARETAYQGETIVEPEHRGHGLGLVLKAHNHWLFARQSPQTRWLNTWNAESNTHMVGINEQLGYRPMEYWTEWQLDRT